MSMNKRGQKGFTLVEMVASLLTVTIVTALFLVLVNLVKNTYEDMEMNSDGQILASTLTNYVQDELRFASEVDPSDSQMSSTKAKAFKSDSLDCTKLRYFTYYSGNLKVSDQCELKGVVADDGKERVCITFVRNNSGKYEQVNYPLVGSSSYIFGLNATIDATYHIEENKFYVIIDVYHYTKSGDKSSIITSAFTVEPLNKNHRLYTSS